MTQREQFEAWARDKHDLRLDKNGDYRDRCAFQAWDAWQAACPEGWQAVPKSPDAAMYAILKNPDCDGVDFHCLVKWNDLLSAAPKPGDV